jgi:hypothetical protein
MIVAGGLGRRNRAIRAGVKIIALVPEQNAAWTVQPR